MTTMTSGGPTWENPAQGGRFECDDDHTYHPATTPPPPPSRPNASWRWLFSVVSTLLLPPPPPSHPNVSRRWFFSVVPSTPLPPPPSCPNVNWRWLFWAFQPATTTSSSLMSQRELEVVFFRLFQHIYHRHHLPRIQMRARIFGVYRRWGVSFLRYQQRGGAKLTLHPVQLFSLLLGQHVTSLPCLPPPNNNEGWPPRRVDRAVCGRHATLFAFLYFLTHKLCYYCYWYCY